MNGYYINLSHRTDRKTHIENLKQKYTFFQNIERFDAILNKRGDIGCSLSHIHCLTQLLNQNKDYYLIMEDDFFIMNDVDFQNFEANFQLIKDNDDWDVLTLTPRGDTIIKNYLLDFNKIVNNQTATCYIVKHNFIEKLLSYFKKGVSGLMNNEDPNINALDQCWKPLQHIHNFIYYKSIFAGQMQGYSDIEKKNVNYNERFIQQINY